MTMMAAEGGKGGDHRGRSRVLLGKTLHRGSGGGGSGGGRSCEEKKSIVQTLETLDCYIDISFLPR